MEEKNVGLKIANWIFKLGEIAELKIANGHSIDWIVELKNAKKYFFGVENKEEKLQNNLIKFLYGNIFFNKNASLQMYKSSPSSMETSKAFLSPVMSSSSIAHASSLSSSLQERKPINVRISSSMTACGWIGVIGIPKFGQC